MSYNYLFSYKISYSNKDKENPITNNDHNRDKDIGIYK